MTKEKKKTKVKTKLGKVKILDPVTPPDHFTMEEIKETIEEVLEYDELEIPNFLKRY